MWRVLIAAGWLYVAVMMALAQAFHPDGGVLSAVFVLLAYGAAPVALILYVLGTPGRRRARRAREQAQQAGHAPTGDAPMRPPGG